MIGAVSGAARAECLDYGEYARWIGGVELPDAGQLALSHDYAFVANESYGLKILDVSDVEHPRVVSGFAPGGYVRGVAIVGDVAYLVSSATLFILDVSDLLAPALISTVDLPHTGSTVTVAEGFACITAYGDRRLEVVDVTDPTSPGFVAEVLLPTYPIAASISGGYAYVAGGSSGLQIVDLVGSSPPAVVGTLDTPGHTFDVLVSGHYAYLAEGSGGLRTVDVSDPMQPATVDTLPDEAFRLSRYGEELCVKTDEGFELLDVSVPESPVVVSKLVCGTQTSGMAVVGDRYVVTTSYNGALHLFDLVNPLPEVEPVAPIVEDEVHDFVVVDGIGYVASGVSGLKILDMSVPQAPVEIGRVGQYHEYSDEDVDVEGDLACVSSGEGYGWWGDDGEFHYGVSYRIQLIDVSDPTSPQEVGVITGFGGHPTLRGDRLYICSPPYGLVAIDVTDPSNPIEEGAAGGYARNFTFSEAGDKAYVASGTSGVEIVDLWIQEIPN